MTRRCAGAAGCRRIRRLQIRRLTYVLLYQLSNIVLKDGDDYKLDHDFLFPEREGVITRASVALTFDPEWQPQTSVQSRYTAEQLPPGQGLVLTIPLRYTGAGVPVALATNLPPGIIRALWSLLVVPIVVIGWVFARERWYGRFAPLKSASRRGVDSRAHRQSSR